MNEAKSHIATGSPKLNTVICQVSGDKIAVTVEGTGGDGKPLHSEWTGKFDEKDYPVAGDPSADERSYRRVNSHRLAITDKKCGKTENQLRRGVFTSVEALQERILAYIQEHNRQPKPFIWTAKANDILEKVKRAKANLNNSLSV